MAKTVVKISYVKLGEQANSFYCTGTRLKISRGQVIKIDENKVKKDGKIYKGLLHGHLERTTAEDYDDYQETLSNPAEVKEAEVNNEPEPTKAELVEEAITLGSELSKSKLKKLSVDELNEEISILQELED